MKNNKKQNLTPIEDLISVVNAGENSGVSEEKINKYPINPTPPPVLTDRRFPIYMR